ncbi:hypothetical protein SCHPADRAFT_1000869 [Schizopora paradoxa]|uniref:DUF6534 domain-containing protein n=1 Tax=Schizopora paradoxa TaxID=27342 RepID=A0A0H2R9M8_9AGAM|nr:hypothetical protein SCHPADRAFT_1000869 [Schizopora paradoxa]
MSEAVLVNVTTVSGPLLLGYLFNWGLFGVLSVQVYFYYLAFPRDRRLTKWLVCGIYILELSQTILLTHDAFGTYAIHYGDDGFLNNMQLIPLSVPIFSGMVSCAVQMHYGYLLRKLSGSRLLGFAVAFFAIAQCTAAFVQGVQAFIVNDISALATKAFASETIWLAGSAICDLIIASGMTYILLQKDTRLPATHALITKLVRVIVETGCLTAVSATIQMALFISLREKPYFTCIGLALAKLYSNSLLAILNSRIRIEGVHSSPGAQVSAGSSFAFYERSANGRRSALPFPRLDGNGPHIVDVRIQRQTETWTDDNKSKASTTTPDLDSILSKA